MLDLAEGAKQGHFDLGERIGNGRDGRGLAATAGLRPLGEGSVTIAEMVGDCTSGVR